MKHRVTNFWGIFAIFAILFTASCVEYNEVDLDEIEQVVFDEWMAKYHPDLLANYQSDDGYYIDIVTVGDTSTTPIKDTICWIEYDLTGYDLYGNVTITRNDIIAWQQGSFTTSTHYVPYYRYTDPTPYEDDDDDDDDDYVALLECTQMAFSKELTIGDQTDVVLYDGAEFTLYSPSSIISSGGTDGTGGYEGQYTLTTMPFICTVKVINVVKNPLLYEQETVDGFAIANGGLTVNPDSFNANYDDDDDDDDDDDEEEEEYTGPNAWTNATSYIPQVYLNSNYVPDVNGSSFNYVNTYTSTVPSSPYTQGMSELDRQINEALEARFANDYTTDGSLVEDNSATIWYICRFLDGFILDTNIDEVTELIHGTEDAGGTAITYDVDSDESSYISAWYYSIPKMRYGSWSAIITSSSYAYGSSGTNGDTSTSSSSSYSSYYNYYSGYSSYYNSYSSYYNSSYYDYSYNSSSTTTTTTVTTEVLPYTPLIFEIYIEAGDDPEDDDD